MRKKFQNKQRRVVTFVKDALTVLLIFIISCLIVPFTVYAEPHTIANFQQALNLLQKAKLEFAKVNNYTAIIITKERFNGKWNKTEHVETRFMRPHSVYLRWLPGPYEGAEVSYVKKRDGNSHFLSYESGIKSVFGVTRWHVNNQIIRNLYPHHFNVRDTSIKYFIEVSDQILTRGKEMNHINVEKIEQVYDPYIGNPATKVYIRLSDNPDDGLYWSYIEIYFDQSTSLPLHFTLYGFNGEITGEYAFTNFVPNTNVTARDFVLQKKNLVKNK
jgi:hypothetical protein